MKSSYLLKAGVLRKISIGIISCSFALVTAFPVTASTIIANFEQGNDTQQVDAWRGKNGDGWLTDWKTAMNSNVVLTGNVTSVQPFSSGGNRLEVSVTSVNISTGAIARRYDSSVVNYASRQTVSFDFRLDSATSTANRFYFFDNTDNPLSIEGTNATWGIRGNLGANPSFFVYNRTSLVDTRFAFLEDKEYRFTVDIFPSSVAADSFYTVRIDNVTDGTSYVSEQLLFYKASTGTNGFLNFTARAEAGQTLVYSLGNIQVIPEPSALALGGISLLLVGARVLSKSSR